MVGDPILPTASRLSLYLSGRYLQELEIALRLAGIRTRYERPGIRGIALPRLCVKHPDNGWMIELICAVPVRLDDAQFEWWFEWCSFVPSGCPLCAETQRRRICVAKDMTQAARIIADQLHGKR